MIVPAVAGEGVVLDFLVTGTGNGRTLWIVGTSVGDGTFYEGRTLQRFVWASRASKALVQDRPESIPGFDAVRLEAFYAAQDLRTYVVLLVLIPTAMVQCILFGGWRFNLAECYPFLAYVFGHSVWLAIVGTMLPMGMSSSSTFRILSGVLAGAYVLWALRDFYRSRTLPVLIRGLVIYAAFAVGMLASLQILISWRMGW